MIKCSIHGGIRRDRETASIYLGDKIMKYTTEAAEKSTVKITMEFDGAEWKSALEKAYQKTRGRFAVNGFRKGKAPKNVIEHAYGKGVFYEDGLNILFSENYPTVLEEKKEEIEAVGDPELSVEELTDDKGVLVAVTPLRPDVKIGSYKGMKIREYAYTVKDTDIDAEIERLRERNARLVAREGKAQDGDITDIDFEGFVDGEAFDGGKGEHFSLTLGSGQFIPGFEEQIVGHEAGEEFDVNVTFPEDYHAKELAGKAAVFKVKLNEVQYKELPVADDEFAKDVSEYDTLDEFKASIRKNMEEAAEKQAELEVENALVDQLVATLEGDIPPVMIETRIDEMVRDFDYRLSQQGLRLADYLKYIGGDEAKFREGFKEQAEKQVKMRLALEAVAKAENIEASEEDFENEVKRIADTYKMEVEKVRSIIPVAEVKKDLAVNKAIDFIKSKAEITAKKAEEKSE